MLVEELNKKYDQPVILTFFSIQDQIVELEPKEMAFLSNDILSKYNESANAPAHAKLYRVLGQSE